MRDDRESRLKEKSQESVHDGSRDPDKCEYTRERTRYGILYNPLLRIAGGHRKAYKTIIRVRGGRGEGGVKTPGVQGGRKGENKARVFDAKLIVSRYVSERFRKICIRFSRLPSRTRISPFYRRSSRYKYI